MEKWTFSDAVNLALDAYSYGEIKFRDIDKYTNMLWREMQKENAGE